MGQSNTGSDETEKLREEHGRLQRFTERELLRFSRFTADVAQFLSSGSPEDKAAALRQVEELRSLGYGGAR